MRSSRRFAAAALAGTGFLAASITLTPASQDWGNVAVNAFVYKTFKVGGLAAGDSATATITGANADNWYMQDGSDKCWEETGNDAPCNFEVTFRPKSKGQKTATLNVKDFHGNRMTAPLKGNGVEAMCEMKVVFCNYGHMYKGVFSWQEGLAGGNSSTSIVMQADIDGLRVTCNGTETTRDPSGTHVKASNGNGLVAVEFKVDDTMRPVYNITVACPSPGDSESPSDPAELGHFDQQSYDQRTTTPNVPIIPGVDLVGSSSYPNPANDPVNGVTGNVIVRWSLKRK